MPFIESTICQRNAAIQSSLARTFLYGPVPQAWIGQLFTCFVTNPSPSLTIDDFGYGELGLI